MFKRVIVGKKLTINEVLFGHFLGTSINRKILIQL